MPLYSAREQIPPALQYGGRGAGNVGNTNAQVAALLNDNHNLHLEVQKLHTMVYQMKNDIQHDRDEQRVINVRRREYDCCVELCKADHKSFEYIQEHRVPGCGVYDSTTSVEEREQLCTEREYSNKLNFLMDHKFENMIYLGPFPPGCGA